VRAFLTGATGTVGREVSRALLERGASVRVGTRAPGKVLEVLPEVQDSVSLDYGATTISPSSFSGCDALFFMTPLIEDQVASSQRVLEAALEGGVEHVVRLSSRSAGWDEQSALRAWHRKIDDAVRSSAATWTILRPCSFFQNFIKHQAATIRNMSAIILPQGEGLIPYIDAADIGDAAVQCLMNPDIHAGQTYVLTGGRAYGPKGVAAEIARTIGRPVTYIDIEPTQAEEMMRKAAMPDWLLEAALAVFAHAREGGEATVDPALARILDRPATSLSEFVERNREAWQ